MLNVNQVYHIMRRKTNRLQIRYGYFFGPHLSDNCAVKNGFVVDPFIALLKWIIVIDVQLTFIGVWPSSIVPKTLSNKQVLIIPRYRVVQPRWLEIDRRPVFAPIDVAPALNDDDKSLDGFNHLLLSDNESANFFINLSVTFRSVNDYFHFRLNFVPKDNRLVHLS